MIDAADHAAWQLFDEHLAYRDDEHRELLDAVAAALRARDARVAELERELATHAAQRMPHSYVRMRWACGHEAAAACQQCFAALRVAIDALEDER